MWSFFQMLILILVSIVQVVVLRSFFANKKYRSTTTTWYKLIHSCIKLLYWILHIETSILVFSSIKLRCIRIQMSLLLEKFIFIAIQVFSSSACTLLMVKLEAFLSCLVRFFFAACCRTLGSILLRCYWANCCGTSENVLVLGKWYTSKT